MGEATGLAEKMLGLDGFRVLEVAEAKAELVIHIETVPTEVLCGGCGAPAEGQDRISVEVARPAVLPSRHSGHLAQEAVALSRDEVHGSDLDRGL